MISSVINHKLLRVTIPLQNTMGSISLESGCILVDKVVLRPSALEDRQMIFEWLAHSDITSSMIGPPTFPDQPIPSWAEFLADYEDYYFDGSAPEQGRSFVIMVDGEPVGQINYGEIDGERRRTELDIWLKSGRHTGKGFGSAALKALTSLLRREFGVAEFVIRPSTRNPRAIRAYEKAGFRRIEISPEEATARYGPGDYTDDTVMIKSAGNKE